MHCLGLITSLPLTCSWSGIYC